MNVKKTIQLKSMAIYKTLNRKRGMRTWNRKCKQKQKIKYQNRINILLFENSTTDLIGIKLFHFLYFYKMTSHSVYKKYYNMFLQN